MLQQGLILTSQREYAHAMRMGLLGLGDLNTRVDVELDALRAMQLSPQQYDLILLDVMLDSMDGLQLLQLMKQQAPTTKFIVVSDAPDETSRAHAYQSGADFFLQRPRGPESLKHVLEDINALLKAGQDAGGRTEQEEPEVRIADIVQTRCLSGDTILLLVRSRQQSGDIFIYRGEIYHAQYPGKSGEGAFYDICRWDEGMVKVKELKLNHVPPRTIELSYRDLLEKASDTRIFSDVRRPTTGQLLPVSSPNGPDVAEVLREAPPLDENYEALTESARLPDIPFEGGTQLPNINAHWKVNLMGELVEGSQVAEPERCAIITYFIYRKLADIAVALEVDYFNNMTLLGPHLQQVLVADNMGVRHGVFDASRTNEADREQYVKWCCEQSF